MFNPMKAVRILDDIKALGAAHPDVHRFLKSTFLSDLPTGTEIEMRVRKPGKKTRMVVMTVTAEDLARFESLKDAFK